MERWDPFVENHDVLDQDVDDEGSLTVVVRTEPALAVDAVAFALAVDIGHIAAALVVGTASFVVAAVDSARIVASVVVVAGIAFEI